MATTKQVANSEKRKPPAAGKGRPKGAQNKTTTTLKQAILVAAAKHGHDGKGKEGLEGYLTMVAEKDVKSFCSLLGKVLPMTVASDPDNPFEIISKIELVGVKAK
mgnify:CR=1 FL=1